MAAKLAPTIWQRFFDDDGAPLAGGKLWSYQSGTLTPLATYTDQAGLVANSNPVILDAEGFVATSIGNPCGLWLLPDSYKFILTDANDVQLKVLDNVDSTLGVADVSNALNNAMIFQAGPISDRPAFNASYGQANHGRLYFATDENKAYRDTGVAWVDVTSALFPGTPKRPAAITYVIDGGGVAITPGIYGQVTVPSGCTIQGWYITSDVVGAATVNINTATFAGFPTMATQFNAFLSTEQKHGDTGLSVVLAFGDQIQFEVVSAATVKRLNITLVVELPAVSA